MISPPSLVTIVPHDFSTAPEKIPGVKAAKVAADFSTQILAIGLRTSAVARVKDDLGITDYCNIFFFIFHNFSSWKATATET